MWYYFYMSDYYHLPDPNVQIRLYGYDQWLLAREGRSIPQRSERMRQVAGPALDCLVRPIYDAPLTAQEIEDLEPLETFGDLLDFREDTAVILENRLDNALKGQSELSAQIEALGLAERMFHNSETFGIVSEGLETGLTVPLTVATHVYGCENDISELAALKPAPFDYGSFTSIFTRPSFNKILHRLTKGPNGFLGSSATRPNSPFEQDFFEFSAQQKDEMSGLDACIAEPGIDYHTVYELEQGQVVDLSSAYHAAALRKRQQLRSLKGDSSGCPVRHRFKDESAEIKDSIITISTRFVLRALEATGRPNEVTEIEAVATPA
jgi:hypothetical protein